MTTTDKLAKALRELHAMVWGECPSLLNEDSGGNARLDYDCEQALAEYEREKAGQAADCDSSSNPGHDFLWKP